MAGRGRGGGGRGRGRGSMSFNVEQLGFTAGEALPGPVLQPPPLYPPLERRPVPLQGGPEVEYLLALKRDFVEFLKCSPAYVLPAVKVKDIERYSDCKNVEAPNRSGVLEYDWKIFPAELRPLKRVNKKRKIPQSKENHTKEIKLEDVKSKLEELEKIEEQGETEEKSEENQENEKEEGERPEEELEEEADQDEEMDDGTDYVNNYFDNGESYLDEEDDNLDDGPVY